MYYNKSIQPCWNAFSRSVSFRDDMPSTRRIGENVRSALINPMRKVHIKMSLQNKTILFLGSSVTYGSAAKGVSFVDLIRENCGAKCIKEAVSGTTLADVNEKSYVSRLKTVSTDIKLDLFVCQLSTNDATRKISLAEVEAAIRFILTYVEKNFSCPIVFYTGTYFENAEYVKMIELLYSLKKEYDFSVLDLYYDKEMSAIRTEDYERYMRDPIHPNLLGYTEWWTPKFIACFERILAND